MTGPTALDRLTARPRAMRAMRIPLHPNGGSDPDIRFLLHSAGLDAISALEADHEGETGPSDAEFRLALLLATITHITISDAPEDKAEDLTAEDLAAILDRLTAAEVENLFQAARGLDAGTGLPGATT